MFEYNVLMKAYSYSRFSSEMQRQGGSIDRQQTLARQWCEEHQIELATETFEDQAVSGFHGDNLTTGALSRFIARVKSGDIERGSYLILENLDRLTRLKAWEASGLLQDLVGMGIVVITLRPEMRFDHTSDALDLLKAILHMDNSHKESARKSDLGKIEWAKRFERARGPTKHHIGGRVSNWLTLDKLSGKYLVNCHAFAVGRIFELCLQGLGSTAIAQTINAEGYPTFNKGKRWGTSAVITILRNRAAIGELALKDGKEPIPDYFTPVVDVMTFDAAQAKIKARKTGDSPKESKDFNVWAKLVFCGVCGSSMHIIQRANRYLTCANRRYGQCEGARNVRLDESEDVFLLMLQELDALHFAMPDPTRLSRELLAAEGRLEAERAKHAIWLDKLTKHPEIDAYHDLVIKSDGLVKAAKAEVERLTVELTGSSDKLTFKEARAKVDMRDKDTRRRANAFVHRLGIRVFIADGYLVVQKDEARAVFAVAKNRIGSLGLEGDPGDIPDLHATNALANSVKTLVAKPSGGFVYRGDVTTPNGRGTRRVKTADLES
jgi:DNA invertase Pin-like site-specific DNA recombinase